MANPSPVVPVLSQRGVYVPTIGSYLAVTLPGEIVRAEVQEVPTRDVVVVQIKSTVTATTQHGHRTNDILACQRSFESTDVSECWRPINKREVEMRETAQRFAQQAREDEAARIAAEEEAAREAAEKAEAEREPEPDAAAALAGPAETPTDLPVRRLRRRRGAK